MTIFSLETKIVQAIGKDHDELAFPEFDPGDITPAGEMRHLGFDVCEGDRFDRLPEGHIRLYDRLSIWHIKSMPEQKVWVQDHL